MPKPRIWVYSPNLLMNEALAHYVTSLGFDARSAPEGARAALFDLTPFDSPLPPAPVLPCIAIVRSAEPSRIGEVQRLGYHGAHRPFEGGRRLAAALRAIVAGETLAWGNGEMVQVGPAGDAVRPHLTARETQVLGLLMLGLPNKRIAARLGIAERTIKYHVSSLMRKFGAKGRLGVLVKSRGEFRA
jgi:DNA-binding NarL/FixJ family response regulator